MIIRSQDSCNSALQKVEEELLFPQVKEYAENDKVKQKVADNTEELVEYSFIIYQLGTDNSLKGTFEAVSFADAANQLTRFLVEVFGIISPYIDSDERYRSFVVYERNGRR